jgi:hypothetical protein
MYVEGKFFSRVKNFLSGHDKQGEGIKRTESKKKSTKILSVTQQQLTKKLVDFKNSPTQSTYLPT